MDLPRALCDAGARLVALSLAQGRAGNVPTRDVIGDRAWVKPRGVACHRMLPDQVPLAAIADGRVVGGHGVPSSEVAMHLAIYASRPDVGGVAHGHGLFAAAQEHPSRAR